VGWWFALGGEDADWRWEMEVVRGLGSARVRSVIGRELRAGARNSSMLYVVMLWMLWNVVGEGC
jgi:hypothetical protein